MASHAGNVHHPKGLRGIPQGVPAFLGFLTAGMSYVAQARVKKKQWRAVGCKATHTHTHTYYCTRVILCAIVCEHLCGFACATTVV